MYLHIYCFRVFRVRVKNKLYTIMLSHGQTKGRCYFTISLLFKQDAPLTLIVLTRQPLWVILCRLPQKGRKEIEEIVEEMEERNREERGTGMKGKKQIKNKSIHPPPLPTTRIVGLAQL